MPKVKRFTIQELVRMEPIEWLVSGLIPTGGLFMFAADPKTGKSLTTLRLALDIAQGQPFIGRQTVQHKVILLAVEDGPTRLGSRFRDLFKISPDSSLEVHAVFNPADTRNLLAELRKEERPTVLIIDPLVNVLMHLGAEDENNSLQVNRALDTLRRFAQETKSTVILVHHMTKGGDQRGKSPRGSTAIIGAVDGWIEMTRVGERSERMIRCNSILRDGDVDPFVFQIVETPDGLKLVVLDDLAPDSLDSAKSKVKNSITDAASDRILTELRGGPLSSADLERALSIKKSIIAEATQSLLNRRLISRENSSRKGRWVLEPSSVNQRADGQGDNDDRFLPRSTRRGSENRHWLDDDRQAANDDVN